MAKKYFDALHDQAVPTDALEQWLADPVVHTQLDPIAYWSGMLAAGHPLASMALDFMSTPGMFLSSFSNNHLNLYYCCSCLNRR